MTGVTYDRCFFSIVCPFFAKLLPQASPILVASEIYLILYKSKSPTLVRCSSGSVVGTVAAKIQLFVGTTKLFTEFLQVCKQKDCLESQRVDGQISCPLTQ